MEFDLSSFTNVLINGIKSRFPYMFDEEQDKKKHPNRNPLHLKDAVFNNLQIVNQLDSITFDIGSETLEKTHPYYHILEDSEVIQKRGKGTTKSKGSQDKVGRAEARDYGIVRWNGKTFSQEYRKNVRGSRSRASKATRKVYVVDSEGQVFKTTINPQATFYNNIHYHYLEKGIEETIPELCATFGLKQSRTQNTTLFEEYQLQENQNYDNDFVSNIIDTMNSFAED